ncbi:MAG: diaminopimelate decarboxylase [Bacteroidota bacterium]|nr:diaminopimelate decarboxylase [Bacteroidota bacterium]
MNKPMFTRELTKKLKKFKTPFYYYDLKHLSQTLIKVNENASKYGYTVHYALKANANERIINLIKQAGLGADCVSGNEVKKAIESSFHPEHIAFAGVGKTDEEINYALDHNIFCFNCESLQELEVIQELAAAKNKKASIALRINPNVNAYTHHYITTGLEENKFGINMWEMEAVLKLLKELPNVELKGLHFHIGSQITNLSAFKNLCIKVNEIQQWFLTKKIILEHINVGGGLGVDYQDPDNNPFPDFEAYFKLFHDFLELQPHQKLHFELGRAIVAHCGSLISKVLYIKKGLNTNFVILDAGMTELIRPALYQSYHKVENISKIDDPANFKYDVVGPICESSDCFGKAIALPETQRGDYVAIRTAGAYGEVMVSAYNLREQNTSVFE